MFALFAGTEVSVPAVFLQFCRVFYFGLDFFYFIPFYTIMI